MRENSVQLSLINSSTLYFWQTVAPTAAFTFGKPIPGDPVGRLQISAGGFGMGAVNCKRMYFASSDAILFNLQASQLRLVPCFDSFDHVFACASNILHQCQGAHMRSPLAVPDAICKSWIHFCSQETWEALGFSPLTLCLLVFKQPAKDQRAITS